MFFTKSKKGIDYSFISTQNSHSTLNIKSSESTDNK